MEYSFVDDPVLRDKLIKARKNGKKVIEKKIIDKMLLSLKRISKCHPFGGSGVDLVPGKDEPKN